MLRLAVHTNYVPVFSSPAFSTPVNLVPRFPVLRFPVPRFQSPPLGHIVRFTFKNLKIKDFVPIFIVYATI